MKPAAELREIAERVKRSTRNPDVLDLCDAVLAKPVERAVPPGDEKRRVQSRERMRRMRAKSAASK